MTGNFHDGFRIFFHEVSDSTDFTVIGVPNHRAVGREIHFDSERLDGLNDTFTAGFVDLSTRSCVWAKILTIHNAVIIAVQLTATAVYFRTARCVWALVTTVGHAVSIRIRFAAIAVNGCACRGAGALVPGIGNAVAISI